MAQTRKYDSAGRQLAREQTKKRILLAAKRLFSNNGLDHVTIDEIAEYSEAAPSTVYALFKSKTGILRALMESVILGEQFQAASLDFKWSASPVEIIENTARIARTVYDNESKELGLLRGASIFSKDLKQLEHEFEQIRLKVQKQRVVWLFKNNHLADGLDLRRARQLMWMFTSREIYIKLVMESGWPPDQYQTWLAETLRQQLLRSIPERGRR
jgi:AcrR family transcriptional regulator